jgi:hypothetical protein
MLSDSFGCNFFFLLSAATIFLKNFLNSESRTEISDGLNETSSACVSGLKDVMALALCVENNTSKIKQTGKIRTAFEIFFGNTSVLFTPKTTYKNKSQNFFKVIS